MFKSLFFGAIIAVISCHRGFHCDPGAEGVGRAATKAFVHSFMVILILDLLLGIFLDAALYGNLAGRRLALVTEHAKARSPTVRNCTSSAPAAHHRAPTRSMRGLRPAARAARHQPGRAARPDAGDHRRERLRQDGAAEDADRAGPARPRARDASTARTCRRLSDKQLTAQRLRFGFLFQKAALFDSLTVADNVAFPLRQHTQDDATRTCGRSCWPGLKEVGPARGVLSKKPAELSGGMRKRVGLARALALNPEVMLYDEPTTGLDPIMSDVINELILQTRREHPVTSIVVTHDMKTVRKVADRVVMLYPLARLEPTSRRSSSTARPTSWRTHATRGCGSSSAARPASG